MERFTSLLKYVGELLVVFSSKFKIFYNTHQRAYNPTQALWVTYLTISNMWNSEVKKITEKTYFGMLKYFMEKNWKAK